MNGTPGTAGESARAKTFWTGRESLFLVAGVDVLLHLVAINRYGYHRDELYFLDCARHLDFGYVDHPPLLDALLAVTQRFLGDSLVAIRIPALLASTAVVVLVALMARQLGGGRFAQVLAGLAACLAPVYLITSAMISVEGLNTLMWTVCIYLMLLIAVTPTPKRWLLLGAAFGAGLLAKYAIVFLGIGLAAGIVLTPAFKLLRSKWPWIAVALAFLILLPNLTWQWKHGWPFIEYARGIHSTMMQWIPLGLYLLSQVLFLNPAALPLWLGGLVYLLAGRSTRPFRLFGVAFVAILVLLIVVKSKPYYPAPAYTILLAAGAVGAERLASRSRLRWLRPAGIAALLAGGLPVLPYAIPVLPVEQFLAYSRIVHIESAFAFETGRRLKLPQYFTDMFGWDNQVEVVASVFRSLPPQEQARAVIYASNFGEAGAVNILGRKYGLPPAVSGHFSYYYWGPGPADSEVVITLGRMREQDLRKNFECVTLAARITHPYAIFYENDLPVYVCRRPKRPIREIWPETRHFS
jgi:4-amino-4-deoxy-L-arabinose transferase-like glycosyltransferase